MRFLFVDRILELVPGEKVRGLKHITWDDTFLYTRNDGRAFFTPSLIGESLGQLAAWNVMLQNQFTRRPVAGVVGRAQLLRPAYVGETLLLESFIDSVDEDSVRYHSQASVNDEVIFRIENALGPLLPMSDFIDEALIRQQFAEIYRPGEWHCAEAHDSEKMLCQPSISSCEATMQFDRITDFDSKVSIQAEKRVTRAAMYFPDHFPKKPVLPLTILLECKLNLAREFIKRSEFACSFEVSEIRKIKMSDFVSPGDVIHTQLTLKEQSEQHLLLSARSELAGKRVCVLDILLTAAGAS